MRGKERRTVEEVRGKERRKSKASRGKEVEEVVEVGGMRECGWK